MKAFVLVALLVSCGGTIKAPVLEVDDNGGCPYPSTYPSTDTDTGETQCVEWGVSEEPQELPSTEPAFDPSEPTHGKSDETEVLQEPEEPQLEEYVEELPERPAQGPKPEACSVEYFEYADFGFDGYRKTSCRREYGSDTKWEYRDEDSGTYLLTMIQNLTFQNIDEEICLKNRYVWTLNVVSGEIVETTEEYDENCQILPAEEVQSKFLRISAN